MFHCARVALICAVQQARQTIIAALQEKDEKGNKEEGVLLIKARCQKEFEENNLKVLFSHLKWGGVTRII
jgi:hypothetical protein